MTSLLNIAPPTHLLPTETLEAAGGFAWWYADLLDDEGNGIVLIWSFGLPFLPGYLSAARAGTPQVPRSRPSLNVSVYEQGKLACYLLQEVPEGQVSWDGDTWDFGGAHFESTVEDGKRVLNVSLNCQLPATQEKIVGTVRIEGANRLPTENAHWEGVHDWSPLTAVADGRCDLRVGDVRYQFQGRGYHDCNAGFGTFSEAGIHSWAWGRVPREDRELVYYVLWNDEESAPQAEAIEIFADGSIERLEATIAKIRWKRGRAGMRYVERIALEVDGQPFLDVRASDLVDDGPFYVRHFVRDAQGSVGMGEFCRPDLIDLAIHRPLVRMRVHKLGGENSVWLPLFTGPRPGRFGRLLAQLIL